MSLLNRSSNILGAYSQYRLNGLKRSNNDLPFVIIVNIIVSLSNKFYILFV